MFIEESKTDVYVKGELALFIQNGLKTNFKYSSNIF